MQMLHLLIDSAMIGAMGVWMIVAVADNWRHPALNLEAVAMVLRFDLMAEQYPEDFKQVAHRRIDDPKTIKRMFHALRMAETIAAAALIIGSTLLLAAAFGIVSATLATAVGLVGAAFFTLVWAGFLIGGNYFAYWYSHVWAQSNHFMLMYWGLFVLLILLN